MRQALNENPIVQLAVFGVVGVVGLVLLYTTVLKGEETPTESTPAAAEGVPAGTVPPPADAAPEAAAPAPAPAAPAPAAPAPPAQAPGQEVVPAEGLLPGKGLPKDVLVALAEGRSVAILVVDPKGISDRKVEAYTESLSGRDDVAVFTVAAKNIARYARITEGVNVNRTPALVVVSPRERGSDELVASVSYGFRGVESVQTALEDALYQGGTRPSFPK